MCPQLAHTLPIQHQLLTRCVSCGGNQLSAREVKWLGAKI